jgi:aryl-alcohol dehydrogenase-like predicted oxidoreductase
MTTSGQRMDSPGPAPAPGGTARLAGRTVARIGFGAMQLEHQPADREAALAVLRQAVRAGVNHIDTAQFYVGCNALIRAALSPYPDDLVLVSKVGAGRDGSGNLVPAQRPEQLRAQLEATNRPKVSDNPTVAAVADEVSATPAQVGLAWLLSHYDGTLLIPGTADPAHLTENIAAGAVRLPAASVAALDQLAASR